MSTSSGARRSARFAVSIYSFVLTLLHRLLLQKTIGFRVTEEEEMAGIDSTEHAETGYDLGTFGAGARDVLRRIGAPSERRLTQATKDQEVTA